MIKTPQTHPGHSVVGRYWGAHSLVTGKTEVFFCESYDPAAGYNMVSETIPGTPDRRCISERAPWATWWPCDVNEDYYYVTQWGVRVPKLKEAACQKDTEKQSA